jgi:hypothetical protein
MGVEILGVGGLPFTGCFAKVLPQYMKVGCPLQGASRKPTSARQSVGLRCADQVPSAPLGTIHLQSCRAC